MTLAGFIVGTDLRGQWSEQVDLGAESWFGCGGKADFVYVPADLEDLACFVKVYPADEPLMVLGGMANTIVRDGGIRGCVVRLGKSFADIVVNGLRLDVGAGALNGNVAAAAARAGIAGLEFLSGIPGTMGGACRMNAGAYGSEVRDVLIEAVALDRSGLIHTLAPVDLKMGYRHTAVPEDYILVYARLQGRAGETEAVKSRLKEIKTKRNETQPIREKTGGSTFANPSDAELAAAGLASGLRAWQLVDMAGCRGLQIGGARMSEMHCNFMVNTGGATASDLENLGDEVIRRVLEVTGVTLRWEIKRIGVR